MRSCVLILMPCFAMLSAQEPDALIKAKVLDQEIQKLPNLPEATRDGVFRETLQKIREEPKQYRLALASNLAVSAGEAATESATLQETADLLVEELPGNPSSGADLALTNLAEFAFYRHIKISLDTPLYRAKLAELDSHAKARAHLDFTLADLSGRKWRLKD